MEIATAERVVAARGGPGPGEAPRPVAIAPEELMEVMHQRCAGLHSASMVRFEGEGRSSRRVKPLLLRASLR